MYQHKSFPYAEVSENVVEDVLAGDFAGYAGEEVEDVVDVERHEFAGEAGGESEVDFL